MAEYLSNVKNRVKVFEWLHSNGQLETVPFVMSGSDEVVRTMDKAVILIEGGSENDFKALDMPPQGSASPEDNVSKKDKGTESSPAAEKS